MRRRVYMRFYGRYKDKPLGTKRFSFVVRFAKGASGRFMHWYTRKTCQRILSDEIPVHKAGQIFTPSELSSAEWVEVRTVLAYQAGAEYEWD